MLVGGTHETPVGKHVAEWFGRIVGKPQFGPYSAMGWQRQDGSLSAAVLFNDYNGANVEIHMVGKIGRHGLKEAFRYAFTVLNVQRITAKPYRCNYPLRHLVQRLGFVPEGVMKHYYGPAPSEDAFVFRLERAAAEKWMA